MNSTIFYGGKMKRKSNWARYMEWDDESIGVQFNEVGSTDNFYQLLDSFKNLFRERHWDKSGWWIIPRTKWQDLNAFCLHNELTLKEK